MSTKKKNFFKNYWAALIPIFVLIVAVIYLFTNKKSNIGTEDQIIGMEDADFELPRS